MGCCGPPRRLRFRLPVECQASHGRPFNCQTFICVENLARPFHPSLLSPCILYLHFFFSTGQYRGMYPPTSQPTSSYQPSPSSSLHSPTTTSSIHTGAAASLGITAASISEEEERRHFEESERITRQSLESAVEDKIRRQVKQVLDSAEVQWTCRLLSSK